MRRLARHLARPAQLPGVLWKNLREPFTIAAAERRFDRRLGGIDTAGCVPGEELNIPDATVYHACAPRIVARLLDEVADPGAWTFVDIGAGKGRAVLLAARMPFIRVIGIELNPELLAIAQRNLRVVRGEAACRAPVEMVLADAAAYEWPSTPCVFFLYRPFVGEAAERVIGSIVRSFHAHPRRMLILYYTQEYPAALLDPIFTRRDIRNLPRDRLDRFARFGFTAAAFSASPSG